ncbi:MAG: glycyl-radical enzyme activating protein [Candidatus Lokiarchaeota archaeon]|nr:glycyl-radical enzyme activating protein [Candidatus Lokiarchaeota archaeon]
MNGKKGLIHKVERFSLHDGPGIRTLVIMKGCPLKCSWCSSPYTQSPNPEILYIKSKCTGCGRCIETCQQSAITWDVNLSQVITDRTLCIGCGKCVSVCLNAARELSGRSYTIQQLFQEVEKDAIFYRRSGGGITIGGGEPTLQAEFVGEFLSICQSHFFHTAMETCALTSWEKFAPLLDLLDLVYIDLKHMNDSYHIAWTGASNREILKNIRKAAQKNQIILRIPLIPGFNDSTENITESARFAKQLGKNIIRLELLPYHQFGIHKYEELERTYTIESIQPPSEDDMVNLQDIVRSFGIEVKIGG